MLSVDDEPAVSRAVARDLRRRYGDRYRVVRANTGPEALSEINVACDAGLGAGTPVTGSACG
ncbi:hypothetical protein [Micromonospora sp. NPDC003816]|uniref:hypothetical protein n=1 Tax=Micromonospora sp. NPDC003816 TaxID=3364224 RepID=UPI0036C26B09